MILIIFQLNRGKKKFSVLKEICVLAHKLAIRNRPSEKNQNLFFK